MVNFNMALKDNKTTASERIDSRLEMVKENTLSFQPEGSPLDQAINQIKNGKGKSFNDIDALMLDLNSDDVDN